MLYTRENFPEISTEPDQYWTWFIRITFTAVIASLLFGFFSIPILLYWEREFYGPESVLFLLIYYPVLCVVLYLLVKMIIRNKKKAVHSILVNSEGAFYKKHDGSSESILYKNLQRSDKNYTNDIFTEPVPVDGHNLVYLKAFYGGKEIRVDFTRIDIAFGSYAKNHRVLRSHFLNGVKIFRTDLVIDPSVYKQFFINPETFEYEKKQQGKALIWTVLLIVTLFFVIYFWNLYS